VATRIIMKRAYYIGAARIADKLDSGFPRGSYDDSVEHFTASVAITNGYRLRRRRPREPDAQASLARAVSSRATEAAALTPTPAT
jgi:hypothetical protein